MSIPSAVAAKNIGKHVTTPDGVLTILEGISFEIKQGESVSVVGASGSGKSTLLGLLAGLDTPSQGDIMLNGEVISSLGEDERAKLRGEKVGFVFQSFHLIPALTALENVMLPLELAGHPSPETEAKSLMVRVGLDHRLQHYPKQLSGGEQQRVAIARAFVNRPPILFADEPTGNLDTHTGERIIELLFQLNEEENTTLILVTHDMQLASACQRQLHIDAGQLVAAS
ncbi:ABC transporter ATP-binding protein [Zooshikella marina]|uniref:ABC transporter ATP-binding protein n=1 Tax=Zooshikella ganghwensis TaxID=202772 RepID=UPI001BAF8D0F|nr:ABC transporter ATP-binding protein [Zooshikella ganghwensis]MBU2707351.1 ABC transporter ATP-binding protein [Zooshikella ganghwensis]